MSSTARTEPTRLAYDDLASPTELAADARVAGDRLRRGSVAERALAEPPSLRFDDQPREARKPGVRIDEAAARLAAALYDR